eukprot:scaffold357_cov400-Prasinococcus_capsulatus_cf.AAC.7
MEATPRYGRRVRLTTQTSRRVRLHAGAQHRTEAAFPTTGPGPCLRLRYCMQQHCRIHTQPLPTFRRFGHKRADKRGIELRQQLRVAELMLSLLQSYYNGLCKGALAHNCAVVDFEGLCEGNESSINVLSRLVGTGVTRLGSDKKCASHEERLDSILDEETLETIKAFFRGKDAMWPDIVPTTSGT